MFLFNKFKNFSFSSVEKNSKNKNIEKLKVHVIDKYNCFSKKTIYKIFIKEFLPMIEKRIKYKKEITPNGTFYTAEISFIKDE